MKTWDIYFVVSSVAFAKVEDEPLEDELSDLREFGVDDGHHGGIDVGKDGGGALSLKHRPRQQTSETHTHPKVVHWHFYYSKKLI